MTGPAVRTTFPHSRRNRSWWIRSNLEEKMKSKNAKTDCVYEMNEWGTMILVRFTDDTGTKWTLEEDEFNIDRWYREE
jgi:hypothetical protein